jgi:anti-anti-sigma factor
MGAEADALLKQIDDLLPMNSRILLHLGEIDFIDSGGLGLLVRCLTRVQNASGRLSICALSPRVADVLRITRLDSVLRPYIAEADAIALAHGDAQSSDTDLSGLRILCADASADLLAYLRGLLKEAGHRIATADNLYDGVILLKAMRPTVVVVGAALYAMHGTASADEFHRQLPPRGVVVLPPTFSTYEAGEAASTLLNEIREILDGAGT